MIKFDEAKKAIDDYFKNVTLEQLNKDLEAAGMNFYANEKKTMSRSPFSEGL